MAKKSHETSGLTLDSVALLDSTYHTNPRYRHKGLVTPKLSAEYSYKKTGKDGEGRLTCVLKVALTHGKKKAPMEMDVTYEAVYSFAKDTEIDILSFATSVAPAHLFPFVREHIANTTGKGKYPPLVLPPVNIARLLKNQSATKPSRSS